eukprot:43936_1
MGNKSTSSSKPISSKNKEDKESLAQLYSFGHEPVIKQQKKNLEKIKNIKNIADDENKRSSSFKQPTQKKNFDAQQFWNSLDTQQTYHTNANTIYIIGKAKRAIGIDLTTTDPKLPSPVGKIDNHMTIFYRSSSNNQFTKNDIETINYQITKWKKSNNIHNIPFQLEPGHGRSANIKGSLCKLCIDIRKACQNICSDNQVTPHVGLLTRNYRK